MSDENKTAQIRAHWAAAAEHELDSRGTRPTAPDPHLQDAIENGIGRYLRPAQRALDIGCGDGLSTLRFAKSVDRILGVDYIDGYVRKAQQRAKESGVTNASFEPGDVLGLSPVRARHGLFDAVITIRCLINLPSVEDQMNALQEIAGVVAPGGLYLISEGWAEGIEGLNLMRRRAGLAEMDIAKHNLLIRRGDLEREAAKYFELVDYIGVGFFLFMSRVVQPLLIAPEKPSHFHPLNKIGFDIERLCLLSGQFDSCDYAGLYVFRRRPH
jgi:SAM-dependent methyltransferase